MAAYYRLKEEIQRKYQMSPPQVLRISLRSPQAASPFFSRFPLEIRHNIYEFALAPDPIFQPVNSYRRDDRGVDESKHTTSLGATCTRIWTETHALFYRLNPIHISLDGSSSKIIQRSSRQTRAIEQYVFPPRGDAIVSDSGDVQVPEVTYGRWRLYLQPEDWAVATLTLYIDPYWPTWSQMGGECLAWWTMDPLVQPGNIKLVIWAVAQLDSM